MTYYRNKLYVAFDGDNDMQWYRLLQAWRDNENIDFGFLDAHDLNIARDSSLVDSIKAQLRDRMRSSKAVLLLVGEKTKYIRGYIPWEIGYARHLDLPLIVANLNKKRSYDADRCPSAVTEHPIPTVHISFEARIIKYSLNNFPDQYRSTTLAPNSKLAYPASVYQQLGL